jgi:hypothetical protein
MACDLSGFCLSDKGKNRNLHKGFENRRSWDSILLPIREKTDVLVPRDDKSSISDPKQGGNLLNQINRNLHKSFESRRSRDSILLPIREKTDVLASRDD